MNVTVATPEHEVEVSDITNSAALKIKVLIKEARRLRRRRWYWVGLIVAVVAGAISLLSGGTSSPQSPGGVLNPNGSPFHLVPLTNAEIHSGLLDYLFPTDAHDFSAGWVFAGHLQMTGATHQLTCMSDAGIRAKIIATKSPLGGDNTVFPNLAELSKSDFQATTSPMAERFSRPSPTSGNTTRTFAMARQRCGKVAFGKMNSLLQAHNFEGYWGFNLQTSIEHSAVFGAYQTRFVSCVSRSGVDVAGIDSFFAYADGRLVSSKHFAVTSHHLSAIYARCIAPLEQWRIKLRSADRSRMVAIHHSEISQLETLIAAYLHA